jgi:hypothetical protein
VGVEKPIPVDDTKRPSALGIYCVTGTVDPFLAVLFTGKDVAFALAGVNPNDTSRYAFGINIRKYDWFNSLDPLTGTL